MAFSLHHCFIMNEDAVVVDHSFHFEDIIRRYRAAHIIAGADVATAINSGVLIIRNSAWSRNFLQMWRQRRTESGVFTDQEGFDRLYRGLDESNRKRIAVLPPAAMNTVLPAMLTYEPRRQPVLHLAAEVDKYRAAVFLAMAQAYCSGNGSGSGSGVSDRVGIGTTGESTPMDPFDEASPAPLNITAQDLLEIGIAV